MAHFAQLDENNEVIAVNVIANADCLDSDNNESETVGLFNAPTGLFRGLENSISFEELGTTGTIIKGGIIIFLGFVLLFWLRGI